MIDTVVIQLTKGILGLQSRAEASSNAEIQELQQESIRQEFELDMAKAQAKVAQEIAIASRIENAAEVEIEEYYEYSGGAGVEAKMNAEGVSVGGKAAMQRVSKRVYRFRDADLALKVIEVEETK